MRKKKLQCAALTAVLAASALSVTGCGNTSGDGSVPKENQFTWWIAATDGAGTFYDDYKDNPAIQWLNNQYWDKENHTLGTAQNGERISLSFQAPIVGAEADNFNTMIATEEYPEILDLSYAESPQSLYESGVLMDITEYVEKYLPNYIKLLDENPELKPFLCFTDDAGEVHYYHVGSISDSNGLPWEGYMYRRDWVVKYAQPTEYVWDWDSDYVKQNGHPKVTPLEEAQKAGDFTGWKKNEVTSFTSSEGDDPRNDYEDNVIFPSGRTDPYTISDWEWMFEAFTKALEERGYSGNTNAYCMSLYYLGYMSTGELVSSFGGGNGSIYVDKDKNVEFMGMSDSFKTYLECMHEWNEKGWLDTKFETRASDQFFAINPNGYSQGMVGLWCGGIGLLGNTIRETCADEADQKDAYVKGCSLPVNDTYGTDAQKFQVPDCLYQGSRVGLGFGLTTKCEKKDIEALFSYINWTYTLDGALVGCVGLNEEQYQSMEFSPDLYKENNITSTYYTQKTEDGLTEIVKTIDGTTELSNAVKCQRLATGLSINGNKDWGYVLDNGFARVTEDAIDAWTVYTSTGTILDYAKLLTDEENSLYSKTSTYLNDYMGQAVPEMIKNGLDGWDTYCKKLSKYNPDAVAEVFQKYVDLAK